MSEGQKLTPTQVAAQQMSGLKGEVASAGQRAVDVSKGGISVMEGARNAQLQSTAKIGGRAAAEGRQSGGWGMGSSMQSLAANLKVQDSMSTQRAGFAGEIQDLRSTAAQSELDQGVFNLQQEQAEQARATDSIADINAIAMGIMTNLDDKEWRRTASAQMAPYLSDPGFPLQGKITALNNISNLWKNNGVSAAELQDEMANLYAVVQSQYPEKEFELVDETGGGYTTFQVVG